MVNVLCAAVFMDDRKQVFGQFYLGTVVLPELILDVICRKLRRSFPNVTIDNTEIKTVLETDVLKRDVLECDKALRLPSEKALELFHKQAQEVFFEED